MDTLLPFLLLEERGRMSVKLLADFAKRIGIERPFVLGLREFIQAVMQPAIRFGRFGTGSFSAILVDFVIFVFA
ncbi:MAG: hypothetical protein ACLSHL_16400 [Alistipes communis]